MTASDILRHSTFHTRDLLRRELEIQLAELEDRWHWVSLEKLFFEKGIYKILERRDFATWDDQVTGIERGFDPYRSMLRKEVTREQVLKLCEKPVRKISKFDIKKAEQEIASIETDIEETKNHLEHLTDYAVNYFQHIRDTYGKGRERKTEIRNFDDIYAANVAVANQKLYANMATGFVGTGLKRDDDAEYAFDCSNMDDIIVFRTDGTMLVTRVQDKAFVGSSTCTTTVRSTTWYIATVRWVLSLSNDSLSLVLRATPNTISPRVPREPRSYTLQLIPTVRLR